jgi:Holliday junction DNA helicase RuvA
MSRLSLATLKGAIFTHDVELLSKCHGIGKKTAERIVIELGDKMDGPQRTTKTGNVAVQSDAVQDAVHALISLGYKPTEADRYVRNASGTIGELASSEELIKHALKS